MPIGGKRPRWRRIGRKMGLAGLAQRRQAEIVAMHVAERNGHLKYQRKQRQLRA